MSTSYHHGDLKAALLACARERMESDSLEGLSMREMAKAAGVSHTAAYRHFQDKRALLEAVAVEGFEEMLSASRVAGDGAPVDARAQLKAIGLAYVRFGLMHPRRLAHMFDAVSQPHATEALAKAGAQLFDLLLQRVDAGQREGAFRADDARQLAHACWAMVHGLATLLGVGILRVPGTDPDALLQNAAQSLDVFLDGMGPVTTGGVTQARNG